MFRLPFRLSILALAGVFFAAAACAPPAAAPPASSAAAEAPARPKTRLSGQITPVGPYSAGVDTGGLVFLAGQIALNPDGSGLIEGGIGEQTHQVMQNLEAVLAEAGLGFGDVVKTNVYLVDVDDFAAMNEVYASYFPEEAIPPARTTVAVAGIPLGALLEIAMIAAR